MRPMQPISKTEREIKDGVDEPSIWKFEIQSNNRKNWIQVEIKLQLNNKEI